MKTKTIYLTIAFGMMLGFSSCNLNYFPSDELSGDVLMSDESGAQYVVDGCYAMLKEEQDYLGWPSGNSYVRHYFQLAEFPADNTCLSGRTTDPLYQAACLKMTDNLQNVGTIWWVAYKVIYTANNVIEGFAEGESNSCDHLLGEAYFLRALMHFHMVTLFGKPYIQGNGSNPGVVLRTGTNTETTTRATVAEVYAQVIKDLEKAAELMGKTKNGWRDPKTYNPGYANKDAALALLSRVYLYMGENQKVLDTIDKMSADPTTMLDGDFENYFANAQKSTSKETLFCVTHTALETRGQASIAAMFLNDGIGWGEVYASDPLLNLYERYPSDKRLSYIKLQEETDKKNPLTGKTTVFFPVKSDSTEFRNNMYAEVKTDASGKYCEIADESGNKTKYRINEVKVNGMNKEDAGGEYTLYYVNYGGEKCPARIIDKFPVLRFTFPNYFVTRFSYQDGDPMLSSPVMLRWAEVVLNRAEAKAKLGDASGALADVDVIRTRAGIPAAGMFSTGNMHGYTDVLDVVLDERRMELAFEGHRMFDVYRNNRKMDRQFGGVHTWEVVDPTDPRIQYPIPYGETSVSGI